ncbi:MAG: hypothetical protein ABI990_09630 [Actinomycetota bacterium]
MKMNSRHAWMLAASVSVVVGVVATVLLAPAGAAGGSGRTYTVKTVKAQGSVWIAGGGKTMSPGHLSAGNRLLETNAVRRDDGVKGVFVATVMVASPGTVAAKRAVGLMRGVYRFGDGDIYVDGFVSFARPSGTGVVVGGTGAYEGVLGTFTSTEAKDVLHLLP